EKRSDFVMRARENVAALGKIERVTFFPEDIERCDEENVADSFFLDVPDPLAVMDRAVSILKGGGRICVLCPTTNQVQESIRLLGELNIVDIQMWEIMARNYKTNPDRLRPEDRMVGHTAFLIFGVKIKRRSRS
ncbi:MAG TPA: SAM-dependent methyltransferase, partial [Mesotoga sp.]|nr:SAM-dependent methyltransferase [Mesotoga sp.]